MKDHESDEKLEQLSYEESIRDLGLFSLEEVQGASYRCLQIAEGRV